MVGLYMMTNHRACEKVWWSNGTFSTGITWVDRKPVCGTGCSGSTMELGCMVLFINLEIAPFSGG